jgi:putative ABC transport system permease protein
MADLLDSKLRTFLVVASIAVGVFAVGTIATSHMIISADISTGYASARPANIQIWTDPFDDELARSIACLPGVGGAEGRHFTTVRLSADGEIWDAYDLVAIDDFSQSEINLLRQYAGEQIPDDNELLIEREAFGPASFKVGDMVQVWLPGDIIRTMPVAGIVQDEAGDSADFASAPKGYMTLDTLEWLGLPRSYNRLLATVTANPDDEAHIEAIGETIEDKLERSGRQVYRTQLGKTSEHPMTSTVNAMLSVMLALGLLIVLLSGSLIANTLNALLSQHLRQIGVMKLVGARSFQIMGMYLLLIISFAIIALIIAVPLASVAGYALANFISGQLNITLQGFRLIPAVMILQIFLALAIPLVAGFIPVNNGSKISVRRAISAEGSDSQATDVGRLARMSSRLRWISRPILLSIRNTFRRKGRLALTLFTLIIAGGVFIAVFSARDSMNNFMDLLGRNFTYDLSLDFERPYRITKVEDALYLLPDVEYVEGWTAATAEILDADATVIENMILLGSPIDSQLADPQIIAGRWLQPGGAREIVAADAIYLTHPHIQPGDTLRLKMPGEREEDWTLAGVFRFTNQLDDVIAYADYEIISRMQNMPDQSASFRVVTGDDTLAEQERSGALINQAMKEQGFQIGGIQEGRAIMDQAAQAINILVGFLLAMALLTALVGSIGLTGTMGMNVLERTREIGVMRAIGAVDSEIMKSVIVEGTFIGLISWFFGALLSIPITYALLDILAVAFSAPIPVNFTADGFIIWLGVVLFLSVLASIIPARNAARLTIREVLAYE